MRHAAAAGGEPGAHSCMLRAVCSRSRPAPPCSPCRTPAGGLTLALSRESSVKGGQATTACAPPLSRESSVRGGSARSGTSSRPAASPRERSVSGGQRTYRGLPLAEPRPDPVGCGSTDWMGAPLAPRLADMVSWAAAMAATRLATRRGLQPAAGPRLIQPPCPAPLSSPQLGACEQGQQNEQFTGFPPQQPALVRRSWGSRGPSRPLSCRPSESVPEEVRTALLEEHATPKLQPQEVGSWAQRVTTFANSQPTAQHSGGPDPLLLSAALQALAAPQPAALTSGPDCRQTLVGDSELASTNNASTELQAARLHGGQLPAGGSWPHTSGGSPGRDAPGPGPHLLSSSWDAADAAALRTALQHVQLGGSEPTRNAASSPPPSAHASAGDLRQHPALHQVRCCCSSGLPACLPAPHRSAARRPSPVPAPPRSRLPPLPPAAAAGRRRARGGRPGVEPRVPAAVARGEEAGVPAGAGPARAVARQLARRPPRAARASDQRPAAGGPRACAG